MEFSKYPSNLSKFFYDLDLYRQFVCLKKASIIETDQTLLASRFKDQRQTLLDLISTILFTSTIYIRITYVYISSETKITHR